LRFGLPKQQSWGKVGEELQHMQAEQHQPAKAVPQPLGAGVYAGIAFASLAATCLVGYGMYYAGTQFASQPVIRSLYYVLLWVLGITSALFLFGVLRSAATISGRHWGAMIDVGGPAALAILVVAGGYEFAKLPDAFSLTIRLQGDSPIVEMASGAKIWVDLNGRREHKVFNDDGEVIIQEVAERFATEPVQITFESHDFKLAGPSNSVEATIPASHVLSLQLMKIGRSEQRRRELLVKYNHILDEVSLELSRKKEFLFRAIDNYLLSPSTSNWAAVKAAAQDSAARIKAAMEGEVEYQSQEQLIILGSNTSSLLLNPPMNPPTFSEALQIYGQRVVTLNQIPPGNHPPVDKVREWEGKVQDLYQRMQAQLAQLVRQLQD
jgi:hypothetical protein